MLLLGSMKRAVAIGFVAMLLQSCSGSAARSDASANAVLGLESRLADLKTSWIEADLRVLSSTCPRFTPEIRSRLLGQGNDTGISDYDSRKRACDSLSDTRSSLARLQQQAKDATTGDAFEDVQRSLDELRVQLDAIVQGFPTSSFAASNFPPAAASEYRAKHEALAKDAGKLAADAVAAARDASGAAMAQARSSDHELDKARARLADDGYTRAAADLQQLAATTSAPDIISKVSVIFTEVDGAIGSAQGTGRVGGNPVGIAREAVPAVAPTTFATPTPTVSPSRSVSSDNAAPQSQGTSEHCITRISDPHPPANVRSAPNGQVVATLQNGAPITVENDHDGWLQISAPVAGWVHASVTRVRCETSPPSVGADGVGSWPADRTGYTVILSSTKSPAEAQAKARAFHDRGTSVGTLRSDGFSSLRSGYWVVFTGQYHDLREAQDAAKAARALVPDAYAKQIVPR
jgi:hypothetical protein